MKNKILAIVAVGLLAGPMAATAIPITYNYSDAGAAHLPGYSGSGMSTVDIGDFFGTYTATDVMGGPGTGLGSWANVSISIGPTVLTLVIVDSIGNAQSRSAFYSSYDSGPWISAAEAWGDVVANPRDILLGVTLTPKSVAEPGTLALFGLGLAALGFARRRKTA